MATYHDFMLTALQEARTASDKGEVPVGAVLVRGNEVLARDHNRRDRTGDPSAHAEMLVLRRAAEQQGDWRLGGTTLYVTLEPCPMCAGAIALARIDTVVFGAGDPEAGAGGSVYNILEDGKLGHRVQVVAGIMEEECRGLLSDFFNGVRLDRDSPSI